MVINHDKYASSATVVCQILLQPLEFCGRLRFVFLFCVLGRWTALTSDIVSGFFVLLLHLLIFFGLFGLVYDHHFPIKSRESQRFEFADAGAVVRRMAIEIGLAFSLLRHCSLSLFVAVAIVLTC